MDKLKKLKPTLIANGADLSECREVRKTIGGSLLDPDDSVSDVLRDGEFILIGSLPSLFFFSINLLRYKISCYSIKERSAESKQRSRLFPASSDIGQS